MNRLTGKKRFWLAPIFIVGFAGIVFLTMTLWNNIIPSVFHLTTISFWQAAGLLILSRLLFGFSGHWRHGHHGNGRHLREKWEKMSPEEREKFRDKLREHRHFWDDHHDDKKDE
jgi:hypothetical protein